jgi:hypothetical protein
MDSSTSSQNDGNSEGQSMSNIVTGGGRASWRSDEKEDTESDEIPQISSASLERGEEDEIINLEVMDDEDENVDIWANLNAEKIETFVEKDGLVVTVSAPEGSLPE